MKYKIHVPSEQYGFIEVSDITNAPEAVKVYKNVKRLLEMDADALMKEPDGLNKRQFAQVRKHLLATGEFDPNLEEECNAYQLRWVKDTNYSLRSLKGEEHE